MSKKKSLPIFLGVAAVWFGAHCGPGAASGNQIATFYSRFSIWGLFTGFLAMILLGLCIYYSVEYARMAKTYNFKSFSNGFFHPYEKFFSTFFEIAYMATVVIVIGSCIATGARALVQQFGLRFELGVLFFCVVTILLTIFGATVVRTSSALMTVLILVSLTAVIIIGLASSKSEFTAHWNQASTLPATLPRFSGSLFLPALWYGVLYCGFQAAGNMANVVTVADGLKDRKDSIRAAVVGVLANVLLICGSTFLLFAYPQVLGEFFNPQRTTKSFIPNLEVLHVIGIKSLTNIYVLILILAIITTLVSFAFAVIKRYSKFVPVREGILRDFILVTALLLVCGIVSFAGLDVLVSKGYRYLAIVCVFIVVIPTIVIGQKRVRDMHKEEAQKDATK